VFRCHAKLSTSNRHPDAIPDRPRTMRAMKDKVIVITGASSGIGAKLAEVVAARGARGIALASRRMSALGAVASRLGVPAVSVRADVARREDNEKLRDIALEKFGQIDVWVNNAGRGITRPVSQLTDDDVDEMVRVNVKSALYGMQEILPHFIQRGTGQIVNVSSMLGRVPMASFRSAYNGAKHFLNAITANLRDELRGQYPGIVVSLVSPGVVATEFGVNAAYGGPDSRTLPMLTSAPPRERRCRTATLHPCTTPQKLVSKTRRLSAIGTSASLP